MGKEIEFEIRSYSKEEFAMKYHIDTDPKVAMKRMRQWIALNPELKKRMNEAQLSAQMHYYTPKQVAILVEFLGAP